MQNWVICTSTRRQQKERALLHPALCISRSLTELRVDWSLDNTLSDSHAVWEVVMRRKGSRLECHNRLNARDDIGLLIETPFVFASSLVHRDNLHVPTPSCSNHPSFASSLSDDPWPLTTSRALVRVSEDLLIRPPKPPHQCGSIRDKDRRTREERAYFDGVGLDLWSKVKCTELRKCNPPRMRGPVAWVYRCKLGKCKRIFSQLEALPAAYLLTRIKVASHYD